MQQPKIVEFFESRRRERRPMVLATVVETRGSTYSKAGTRMLIDDQGVFQGMLSGGCLEGDLAIRARQVIESGTPQEAYYDLAGDNEELWGLGVGCDGAMRVFLQAMTAADSYRPFESIAELENGSRRAMVATVLSSSSSSSSEIAAGATVFTQPNDAASSDVPDSVAVILNRRADELLEAGSASLEKIRLAESELVVFFAPVVPMPRLLVLGGGLDAVPLVRFAFELGWLCTVVDHRPAYIESNDFSHAEHVLCCPVSDVAARLDLQRFDLAVVMSHHLVSDRGYLQQLASSRIGYVGLLGPAARRQRLLDDLGKNAGNLAGRVKGPAGFDLGGRGPAAIALSIVAEMQRHLADRALSATGREANSSE